MGFWFLNQHHPLSPRSEHEADPGEPFEAFTGDVVQPQHFLAGLAFVKPLGWISGPLHDTLGWTSLGISTAMDLAAPYTLQRGANGYPTVGDTDVCPDPSACVAVSMR